MKIRTDHSISDIENLPGTTQVGVSYGMFVFPWDRRMGWGTKEHPERLRQFQKLGYDYVLCTVNLGNEAQVKILERFGWKRLDWFRSAKTEHAVAVYGKDLTKVL